MKLFNATQIRSWDAFTIKNEPISSLHLMERAAITLTNWFIAQFTNTSTPIYIFCGNGNNGGDGLAIGRLLHQASYKVHILVPANASKKSEDNLANLNEIQQIKEVEIIQLSSSQDFPKMEQNAIAIDALFGTGLNNTLQGFYQELVIFLNQQNVTRVAVDIPSGLMADSVSKGAIFKAHYTFSFQQAKLAFLFPENQKYVGKWIAKSIQLSTEFYHTESTNNYFLTKEVALSYYKKRNTFEHKGNFGHAILIMGSYGKIGAAMLSTFACMRAGVGLTTVYAPSCGYSILQTNVPEAMTLTDENETHITDFPDTKKYNAIGIGCGLGMEKATQNAFKTFLQNTNQALVLDADALNIISANPELLNLIPENSILTPHPKEFERLFGKTSNDFERNELQKQKAKDLNCYILLKGAYSCIATPEGKCYFNSTGNPGMATGGSGDVLTGIITGLVAQNYSSEAAVCLGVYLHGLAGDLGVKDIGETSFIARDLITYLTKAFLQLIDSEKNKG